MPGLVCQISFKKAGKFLSAENRSFRLMGGLPGLDDLEVKKGFRMAIILKVLLQGYYVISSKISLRLNETD